MLVVVDFDRRIDAQTQRLRVDLDLRVGHPFSSRPLTGHTGISGGLAFDPQTLTVLLTEPQVEKLDLDAVPSGLRDPIAMLSRALGRELLDKYPLVTLEETRAVFENPAHAVSQRISYRRDGERLVATLYSSLEADARGWETQYTPCSGDLPPP